MQQILFIHGGDTFATQEDCLAALRSYTVDPYTEKKKWRMTLKETLKETHTVILPEMPNKQNARYEEWKLWFEKYTPFLKEGDILIGHSLGASFLIRYLSEQKLPILARAVYLISAPYFSEGAQSGGGFRFRQSALPHILQNCSELVFYHSKDDQVVPFSDMERFTEAFPHARTVVFEDRGHFVQEHFPELIGDLQDPRMR